MELLVPRSTRKRKRKDVRDSQSQSQLAAFGFFPRQKKKNAKRPDFERDWDDEVDLQFDAEEAKDDLLPEGRASQRALDGNSALASVPEAPAHPSLRAAGIRELEKRRHASSSSPTPRPAATPLQRSSADLAGSTHSTSHNDPASTLTTSSESGLPVLGSETTRWWEQMKIVARVSSHPQRTVFVTAAFLSAVVLHRVFSMRSIRHTLPFLSAWASS